MRILSLLFLVLCGCMREKVSVESGSETDIFDFASVGVPVKIQSDTTFIRPPEKHPQRDDSTMFIGPVGFFEETGEYFTPLFFKNTSAADTVYDFLRTRLDSTIYHNDEMRRKRLPAHIAKSFFRLGGLEQISIYDSNSHFMSRGNFTRVELYDGPIESEYVAVYSSKDTVQWQRAAFCTGKGNLPLRGGSFSREELNDSSITNAIASSVNQPNHRIYSSSHVKIFPDDVVYSAVAFDSASYFTEWKKSSVTVLKEIKDDYFIIDVLPLQLRVNNRPVFLSRLGIYETDILWTSLMLFENGQYNFMEGNRIRIK